MKNTNNKPYKQEDNGRIERMALLSEELGETIQVIGKILRHGIDTEDPEGNPNRWLLEKELGDVLAALCLLRYNGDVSLENIESMCKAKMSKYKSGNAFLHYQKFREDWPETF